MPAPTSKKTPNKFDQMSWDNEFLKNQHPLSYAGMDAFVEMWCHVGDGIPPYWDPDFSAAMCPVFIGEAGVGKSFRLWKIAQRYNMEYRRVPMGDAQEEDNMGVISREVDERGHHKFTMPPWMPTEKPDSESGLGICFLDEIGTGENGHQNLVSIMLTDGYRNGIFGHTIKAGWFFFAAMNPDEIQYHLNQQMDRRLQDRLFPVYVKPTDEEVLYTLTRLDKLPKEIHGFLRLNSKHIDVISPRSWEQVGAFWARYAATRKVPIAQMLNFMRLKLPPGTIEAFNKYLDRGDDPSAYPMSAKEIMNADGDSIQSYASRMKMWGKSGQDALVAATGYDIAAYFSDDDFDFTDKQMEATAKIVEVLPKTDLLQQIMDAATGTGKGGQLVRYLENSDAAAELARMMDRHSRYQQEQAGR